jgi:hypothetical protein
MTCHQFVMRFLVFLLIAVAPLTCGAQGVLQYVPADAQALVIVKNIGATDAKTARLMTSLHVALPQLLELLKGFAGIEKGLNRHGDALFVVLPLDEEEMSTHFGVWMPVSDYKQFLNSMQSAAREVDGITAVTVADSDLLVAQQGEWALVMDPDQRSRMQQMLAAAPSPPSQIAAWKEWIEGNDVTAVVFAAGMRSLMGAADSTPALAPGEDLADQSTDDLFGPGEAGVDDNPFAASPRRAVPVDDFFEAFRREYQRWVSASPILQQWAAQVTAVGAGARLDDAGNATAGARIALAGGLDIASDTGSKQSDRALPPSLYRDGDYIASAAGMLPSAITEPVTAAYVRNLINDFMSSENLQLDEEMVDDLQKAAQRAAADLISAHILVRPGGKDDGVYTNHFVVVRASAATEFCDHAVEVMQLWNQLNINAEGNTRFVFDLEQVKVGERTARLFSIDIAAADGQPALPEIRQAMEKIFGPGGKMQLWIVPVDDKTALLAMATTEQVTAALSVLDRKQPIEWTHGDLSAANTMLPAEAEWRAFFNAHHYFQWLKRQTEAIVGTAVIGGPLVRDYPKSPAIGLAAGSRAGDVWLEVAVPAATIQAAGNHWQGEIIPQGR